MLLHNGSSSSERETGAAKVSVAHQASRGPRGSFGGTSLCFAALYSMQHVRLMPRHAVSFLQLGLPRCCRVSVSSMQANAVPNEEYKLANPKYKKHPAKARMVDHFRIHFFGELLHQGFVRTLDLLCCHCRRFLVCVGPSVRFLDLRNASHVTLRHTLSLNHTRRQLL